MESKQQTRSTFNILMDHNVPERPLKMDFGDNINYETAFSRLFDGSEKCLTITSARHAKAYYNFRCLFSERQGMVMVAIVW
jgi:hypothetical protein